MASLFAGLIFPNALLAQDATATIGKVNVSSEARIEVEPSHVLYKAFLSTRQEGADKARNSILDATKRLTDALIKSGVAIGDVSHGQILVTMVHADKGLFSGSSKQSFEFEAKATLAFKIRDTSKTGIILDAAARAGISRLSDPAFIVEDATDLRQKARDLALEKSRQKAERYAVKAGMKLDGLISIEEARQPDEPGMWPFKAKDSYGYSGYDHNSPKPGSTSKVPLSVSITTNWQMIRQ